MFITFGLAFGIARDPFLPHFVESVLTCAYCGASITWLILSLSDVPTAMEESATVFQTLYRDELLKHNIINLQCIPRLTLVKALSEIKPIYITVWDALRVDKSLLLNSFGCTLTFGILIMQLKTTDNP
ncbi:uncharacterized protein NPIL_176451 [Nephila pilipes]|uniref:Uncharacterized protein n=1 Tax=Nephila pilipes TaxID=299642 RepID=A0A8X6PI03_NEPPI|nr:uncharacterized protein NPIL_176451 [Nephila pilipes]